MDLVSCFDSDKAFYNSNVEKKVEMPNGLKEVGSYCFKLIVKNQRSYFN